MIHVMQIANSESCLYNNAKCIAVAIVTQRVGLLHTCTKGILLSS